MGSDLDFEEMSVGERAALVGLVAAVPVAAVTGWALIPLLGIVLAGAVIGGVLWLGYLEMRGWW